MPNAPVYVDLFSGCGGFSLGLGRAGFRCAAAIDHDEDAVATYNANIPNARGIQQDLTRFGPARLRRSIGLEHVDLIVGGPPCQGFSKVRKVDGSNHGDSPVPDARRELYRNYFDFVAEFRPAAFVMENVPGIRTADGGNYFAAIQAEGRRLGYRVHNTRICAWRYGIPQKRERELIIGTRRELPVFSASMYMPATHADPAIAVNRRRPAAVRTAPGRRRSLEPPVTLWEAIGDLPPLEAGRGSFEADYDIQSGTRHLERYGDRFLFGVLQADRSESLTGHVARPHSARDLRDFARLLEGETSKDALARGASMEYPYDRENFKDRYTRQHRDELCSTILAHLGKDGLMFIHPTQARSLTVREAARIQTFPDWFRFARARTVAFRQIGNAVPPLLGEVVGRAFREYLQVCRNRTRTELPTSPVQAMRWLALACESTTPARFRALPAQELKRAWISVACLDDLLHPDSVGDAGDRLSEARHRSLLGALAPHLANPVCDSSGWPRALMPLAREASRRFMEGGLSYDEFYCSPAYITGWRWSRSLETENV